MNSLIAILISFIAGAAAAYGTWRLDQRFLKCDTSARGFCAALLAGFSSCLMTLIFGAILLQVPGACGPTQFWGGITPFFAVREAATLTLLFGGFPLAALTLLITLISFFVPTTEPRFLRCFSPTLALIAFGAALMSFMGVGFFPST